MSKRSGISGVLLSMAEEVELIVHNNVHVV